MRRRTMIWKSLSAIVLISALLTSCMDDPEPIALDAVADVFLQRITEDGEAKYALAFLVIANKNLDSVTVEGPDEVTRVLKKDNTSSQVFSIFPKTNEYTGSLPEIGDYEFTISGTQADEAPITVKDALKNEMLGELVIDSVRFFNNRQEITWETLADAEGYVVRLFDESDDMIYASTIIDENENEYVFGVSTQGWVSSTVRAEEGQTYRLELLAILYESGSTTNKDYNVQFISIASTEIVWGE
jgi:hypothetical protein